MFTDHKKVGHRAAEVERVLKPILCGSQRCDTTFVTKALPWVWNGYWWLWSSHSVQPRQFLIKRALLQEETFSSYKPYVIGLTLNSVRVCSSQNYDDSTSNFQTHTLSVLPYTQFITFHIGLCREGRGEDYTFNGYPYLYFSFKTKPISGEEIVAQNRTEPATFPVSTE